MAEFGEISSIPSPLDQGLSQQSTDRSEAEEKTQLSVPNGDDQNTEKRAKFGTRFLTNPQNVFQHNAWDNVVWDEEQESEARSITENHLTQAMPEMERNNLEDNADSFWDKFYGQHQNRFFKDRHWLFTEFPELYGANPVFHDRITDKEGSIATTQESTDRCNTANHECETIKEKGAQKVSSKSQHEGRSIHFLEVGCGVGNTVFPLLDTNKDPGLMVYCCDFSKTAVQILKEHPDYDESRCCAFVWDITQDDPDIPIQKESLDIIIMIFVLSAVSPEKMQEAVDRLASFLRPGGTLLFRDYGRYDLAQLRFKKGRCISENFYVRGDGTRVYFFTQDELDTLFNKAGLVKRENLIDRRLQVNRGKQLKMYRVWIQCKYVKSSPEHISSVS